MPLPLSESARARLALLFDRDAARAQELLENDCAESVPGAAKSELERVRIAALRLSGGDLEALSAAIRLANEDYRDLLMAARFGHDASAHERWWPARSKIASPARAWFGDGEADEAALLLEALAGMDVPAEVAGAIRFGLLSSSRGDLSKLREGIARARVAPQEFLGSLRPWEP